MHLCVVEMYVQVHYKHEYSRDLTLILFSFSRSIFLASFVCVFKEEKNMAFLLVVSLKP